MVSLVCNYTTWQPWGMVMEQGVGKHVAKRHFFVGCMYLVCYHQMEVTVNLSLACY
jgi:hypothetical protein